MHLNTFKVNINTITLQSLKLHTVWHGVRAGVFLHDKCFMSSTASKRVVNV